MTSEPSTAPAQIFPLVRYLSFRLIPVLLKTSITPNQITAVSFLFALFLEIILQVLFGALLLTASYNFDNRDGEVARTKKLSSEFGAEFDDMVDASFFSVLVMEQVRL